MRLCHVLHLALVLSACGGPSSPPAEPAHEEAASRPVAREWHPPDAPSMEETIARATFHASTGEIAPGKTFMLAARFELASGYRMGWINPGDVGKATSVKFEAPEGFTLGTVMFPAPTRFQLNETLTSYGYEDEFAVFTEVRAPGNLSTLDTYRFDLHASWLACKRECSSEAISAYFELTANPNAAPSGFESNIEAQLARVPKPLGNLDGARLLWLDDSTLKVAIEGGTFKEFFPETREAPELSRVSFEGASMELAYAGLDDGTRVGGVAVVELGEQTTFVSVEAWRGDGE